MVEWVNWFVVNLGEEDKWFLKDVYYAEDGDHKEYKGVFDLQ